jgi:hypothetical protein
VQVKYDLASQQVSENQVGQIAVKRKEAARMDVYQVDSVSQNSPEQLCQESKVAAGCT